MVAFDLWGALMVTDFTVYERVILAEIAAYCYAKVKRRGARLDLTTLAETTHIDRRNLKRALRSLQGADVVVQHKDGTFGIQKDWERWQLKGKTLASRLFGGLVAFCFGLVDRFGRRYPEPDSGGSTEPLSQPSKGVQSDPRGGSTEPPETPRKGVQRNPSENGSRGFNGTPPYKERAEEELETGEIEIGGVPSEHTHQTAGGRGDDGSHHPRIPDGFAELCRRADAIPALRAVAFGPKLRGAWLQDGRFAAWWDQIPAEAWGHALNELARGPAGKGTGFFLGIVKRIHREGPSAARRGGKAPKGETALDRLKARMAAGEEIA